jgi:signal transduction histidine kinase
MDPPALAAALPLNEATRLSALRSYGVLDTPVEAAFEDIVRIASHVCDTPIAVVNLIDDGRQWFKSEVGLGVRETPLDTSICAHAILQPGLFEVPDLTQDARFACNPLVTGELNLRFYAGALLQTPDGLPLGTVCVLDTVPRRLSPAQRETLLALARQTMAQLELRRALAATERANRYRGRLMAVAGHDLKQPLQVLSGVLERLERLDLPARDKVWLSLARGQAARMNEELDELAMASRLDDAGLPHLEPFRLAEALEPLLPGWRDTAARKGLRFHARLGTAEVFSDRRMVATTVANLVNNAVKYTDRGGVLVGCRLRGDRVSIEVVDTGPGIPADKQEVIFDAFSQLNAEREGLGLGLSIVRQTADLLGCRVRLTSVPGRGSRFAIDIPRARPDQAATYTHVATPPRERTDTRA